MFNMTYDTFYVDLLWVRCFEAQSANLKCYNCYLDQSM